MSSNEIQSIIDSLNLSSSHKTRHFYLTVGRPPLQFLTKTLEYDNYEEYRILKSLIGISGFVFRKKILSYLDSTKIIPNEGRIYGLSDEEVLAGLDQLKRYRTELMDKDVKSYLQTGNTCGAASLLMALNYYNHTDMTAKNEMLIHNASKSILIEGSHFSGLALQAVENNLDVEIIHSDKEMFSNNQGFFTEETYVKLMEEYRHFANQAESGGAVVTNGINIDSEYVREQLDKGKIVIMAGMLRGGVLHAIVVSGFNEKGFIVLDPLVSKKKNLSQDQFNKFIDTPIGRWGLLLSKKYGAVTKLQSDLLNFRTQAEEYLHMTH
jgi:hypothetical protein